MVAVVKDECDYVVGLIQIELRAERILQQLHVESPDVVQELYGDHRQSQRSLGEQPLVVPLRQQSLRDEIDYSAKVRLL